MTYRVRESGLVPITLVPGNGVSTYSPDWEPGARGLVGVVSLSPSRGEGREGDESLVGPGPVKPQRYCWCMKEEGVNRLT